MKHKPMHKSRRLRWKVRPGRQVGRTFGIGLVCAMAACDHPDVAFTPSGAANDFFANLTVQERAINLALTAPDDTLRLHVSAHMADGSEVLEHPTYTPSDSTVTVDGTGLVTARYVNTNSAYITVSLKHEGVTRSIPIPVQVRSTRPATPVRKITLRPFAGGEANIAMYDTVNLIGQTQLDIAALDANGARISSPDVVLSARTSDSAIATIDGAGNVTARGPGHVTFYISSVIYGVALTDSLPFTVSYLQFGSFAVLSPSVKDKSTGRYSTQWRLDQDTARLRSGGKVIWQNEGTTSVSVVFDHDANILPGDHGWGNFPETSGGNIDAFGAGPFTQSDNFFDWLGAHDRGRKFPVAGVYPFTVIPSDPAVTARLRGVVIVCPASSIMTCNAP